MADPKPFHVDLRGVINLLSRHIYSNPRVYLRELIQNGIDAIAARKKLGSPDPRWGVYITPSSAPDEPLTVTDDGIGLRPDEVTELLATVGSSSKRDLLDLPQSEFLGHFGIGMLSCFMLTEAIEVKSKSVTGENSMVWQGNSNGTYSIEELTGEQAKDRIGTVVSFIPRADDRFLTSPQAVWSLAKQYAPYVDTPIYVWIDNEWKTVNETPLFARDFDSLTSEDGEALMKMGQKLTGDQPLFVGQIRVPGTDVRGTAFFMSKPRPPHRRNGHIAYLGGLLVSDDITEIAPAWAFFVRLVIDTTALTPTASREQFVFDDALTEVRKGIGDCIKVELQKLANSAPWQLETFVATHHLGLWSVACHDDELARLVIPWLPMETNQGIMTLGAYLQDSKQIRYCETVREFQTVSSLNLGGKPIINAGHTYEVPLLQRLPKLYDEVSVKRVTLDDIMYNLAAPSEPDQISAAHLQDIAAKALADISVVVDVRSFQPVDTPAFLVTDPKYAREQQQTSLKSEISGQWRELLDSVADESEDEVVKSNRICFNWASPLVQSLAALNDELVVTRSLRVLYLQAALASSRPLQPAEKEMANAALSDLITLSNYKFDGD